MAEGDALEEGGGKGEWEVRRVCCAVGRAVRIRPLNGIGMILNRRMQGPRMCCIVFALIHWKTSFVLSQGDKSSHWFGRDELRNDRRHSQPYLI